MSGNPKQRPHDEADDLVCRQEENCSDHNEDEDHAGGDHGLAPRRPGDPGHLGADFAHELDWILRRHTNTLNESGRSGGTRTPGPRFWRPMLYQLSYTPKSRPYSLLNDLGDNTRADGASALADREAQA